MKMPTLREEYEAADRAFLASRFPGADRYTWHRAVSAIEGGGCRRNADESRDVALAADADLKLAHDAYIERLHAFYRARDGEHGFLGRS